MTQIEFNNLTPEQLKNLPEESFIKHLKRFAEDRMVDYGKQLEFVFKNKSLFPDNDELSTWYKEHLREMKNDAKLYYAGLIEEQEHLKHGLNPPYLYPYKEKK